MTSVRTFAGLFRSCLYCILICRNTVGFQPRRDNLQPGTAVQVSSLSSRKIVLSNCGITAESRNLQHLTAVQVSSLHSRKIVLSKCSTTAESCLIIDRQTCDREHIFVLEACMSCYSVINPLTYFTRRARSTGDPQIVQPWTAVCGLFGREWGLEPLHITSESKQLHRSGMPSPEGNSNGPEVCSLQCCPGSSDRTLIVWDNIALQ